MRKVESLRALEVSSIEYISHHCLKMIKILLFVAILMTLTSCGLKKDTVVYAEKVQNSYIKYNDNYKSMKISFEKTKMQESFSKFKRYYVLEKWDKWFISSKVLMDKAKMENDKLTRLLDGDDSDDDFKVFTTAGRLKKNYLAASKLYWKATNRMSFLDGLMKNTTSIYKAAKTNNEYIVNLRISLVNHLDTVKKDHPSKSIILDNYSSESKSMLDESGDLLKIMNIEFNKDKNSIDYATFGDSSTEIKSNKNKMVKLSGKIRKRNKELYLSYVKILSDMKIEVRVSVTRESWDEDSEYDDQNTHNYLPRRVSSEVGDYFDNSVVDNIATYRNGLFDGGTHLNVSPKMWARWVYLLIKAIYQDGMIAPTIL